MSVTPLPDLPTAPFLYQAVPPDLTVGGYHVRMHHRRHTIIVSDDTYEYRWLFPSANQYTFFLLLLHRLREREANPCASDFVTIEEALSITNLWTGTVNQMAKHNLGKHVSRLQHDLNPWFTIQTLTSRGRAVGYRLISSVSHLAPPQ